MAFQPHVLLLVNKKEDLNIVHQTFLTLQDNFSLFILELSEIEANIGNYLATNNIGVILSIDNEWKPYNKYIEQFGLRYNKLWIHKTFADVMQSNTIINEVMNCYLGNVTNTSFYDDVISVFTTAYNSKELIYRPYNSLLQQTYKNWEFVIINDSDENDSDEDNFDETQKILKKIADSDPRVKLFNYCRHSGFIGEVKNFASKMCHGYAIVEIDHDDELADTLLEKMHELYKSDESIGFIHSDFCELYENKESFTYGEYFGLGFGSYYNKFYKDRWYATCNAIPTNTLTLTDIVGVPNHVRSWRSSVLHKIGYYNDMLYVADDYDLLIKTFLETKIARLPMLGYFQYRNATIGNHTFKRLDQIRKLQSWLSFKYTGMIDKRISEIFLNLKNFPNLIQKGFQSKNITSQEIEALRKHELILAWERPYDWQDVNFNYLSYEPNKISVVISTYNRPELLKRAIDSVLSQTLQNFEIIVVGDKCPKLETVMQNYNSEKIIWWNLYKNYNDGGATPKNYALRMCLKTKYITYLDDDNYWEPTHLESLYTLFKNNSDISYAFSSMIMGDYKIICKKPLLYRIDTSCVMHKKILLDKYGYWRSNKNVGYANDYDLVSRWNSEKYDFSGVPTMIYNTDGSLNNPRQIYEAYDDQEN